MSVRDALWTRHRRDALRAGLALGTTALAGCTFGYGSDTGLDESFEGTFDWEPTAHIGPEVALDEFEWDVAPTDERAHSGERSLRVFTEGDYDDVRKTRCVFRSPSEISDF